VCAENEEPITALLNEELNIDSDDLENVVETASEEASDEMSESESRSETSVLRVDGWEDVTMSDKKPNTYTFTKNAGPQCNLLPDAEPIDYFSLFFNDDPLHDIVVETIRYARHKISEFQLSPRSI
jgi:hypothetical protein